MSAYREQLARESHNIPGVTEGKEFAHFHNDNEIDIRLIKNIISEQNLSHPVNSKNHPNRSKNWPWIELRCLVEANIEDIG